MNHIHIVILQEKKNELMTFNYTKRSEEIAEGMAYWALDRGFLVHLSDQEKLGLSRYYPPPPPTKAKTRYDIQPHACCRLYN